MPSNPNKLCHEQKCEHPFGGKESCEFYSGGRCMAGTSLPQGASLHTCTMGGSSATGYPTDNGFVVLKGSTISEKVTPSFECASKSYYNLRNRLLADGVIANRVFQKTYTFSSPTAAAAVVAGRIISGKTAWVPVHEKRC